MHTDSTENRLPAVLVVVGALVMAFAGAMPKANSWNDTSRLATVEALVDHGTFAIDESVFHKDFPAGHPLSSETEDTPILIKTYDKLFIDGHFYSDKSQSQAVLLAGVYELLQSLTGLTAEESPRTFCYWMAVFGAGLPYALSVIAVFFIARGIGVAPWPSAALAGSLAVATIAWPYSRSVNAHIALLASSAWMCWGLLRVARDARSSRRTPLWLFSLVGFLGGFGYTVDLGAGPFFLAGAGLVLLYRTWRVGMWPVVVFTASALPWLAVHHAINYSIAGTFGPANANPEFFKYPGVPFAPAELTGNWNHESPLKFAGYALDILFGRHGFFTNSLPMFIALFGWGMLLRRRTGYLPELLFCAGVPAVIWLIYAALSNNYSGDCFSIRWFVPFLAPGFVVLALFHEEFPRLRWPIWLFTIVGTPMCYTMWYFGPWFHGMVPGFWIYMGSAVVLWLAGAWRWGVPIDFGTARSDA